jgi:S1-C subfamily serine protease
VGGLTPTLPYIFRRSLLEPLVGRIGGKFNLGKTERVLSSAIGGILATTGLVLHLVGTYPAPPQEETEQKATKPELGIVVKEMAWETIQNDPSVVSVFARNFCRQLSEEGIRPVIVSYIEPGTSADKNGLRQGMIITHIGSTSSHNGGSICNIADYRRVVGEVEGEKDTYVNIYLPDINRVKRYALR